MYAPAAAHLYSYGYNARGTTCGTVLYLADTYKRIVWYDKD